MTGEIGRDPNCFGSYHIYRDPSLPKNLPNFVNATYLPLVIWIPGVSARFRV